MTTPPMIKPPAAAPAPRADAAFTLVGDAAGAGDVPPSFQTGSTAVATAVSDPVVVSSVPEPASYALMLIGLVALHLWVSRRLARRTGRD